MAEYAALIPVNLITGFLGSGKTTLLNRLLKAPELANTAVLVNEFGAVGLDHLLLEAVDGETVVLQSGCVCCTIRGELADAIRGLLGKRERGLVPRFTRLAIETTGLADPAPIVSTLTAEPVLRHHVRLGTIVTTVDALNGALHLEDNPESVKQVAVADRLVVTKSDLAGPEATVELERALRRLNPTAPIVDAARGPWAPAALIAGDVYDPVHQRSEIAHWLRQQRAPGRRMPKAPIARDAADPAHRQNEVAHRLRREPAIRPWAPETPTTGDADDPAHRQSEVAHPPSQDGIPDAAPDRHRGHDPNRHGSDIRSFCLIFDRPLDWTAFGIWLTMLLHTHGRHVLRVKGVLNVTGLETPVVIHGVQHVVHPPAHLDRWPDDDRRSRIVFIVRGLEQDLIERSLAAFHRRAGPGRDPA